MKISKFIPLTLALSIALCPVLYAAPSNSTTTQAMPSINGKQLITLEKARSIALNKVPSSFITHIELDREHNKYIYDIELFKDGYEYELKIDALTGEGISLFKDKEDWSENVYIQNPGLSTNHKIIPLIQAAHIALDYVNNGIIIDIELDIKNNIPVYSVNLIRNNMEFDVAINALDGSILNIDIDELND